MKPTRLEAFSDGVIAIIITIMVLEIKLPHEPTLYALLEQIPIFISYLLSFVWVGIYWNNHHHLFHVATKVTPKIMWSNLNLLFWMSLMSFVTGWLGENHREVAPMLVYVFISIACGIAYTILEKSIKATLIDNKKALTAISSNRVKIISSMLLNIIAFGFAFVDTYISYILLILISIMWIIPSKQIESLAENNNY